VATVAVTVVVTAAATEVMTEVVTLAAATVPSTTRGSEAARILQRHRHQLMGAKKGGREGPAGTPLHRRHQGSLLCPRS